MANKRASNKIQLSQIEQELTKINPQLFNGLNSEKKQELIRTFSSVTKIHSGPLPDPDTLEAYNRALPDGAKIIVDVFINQSNHRMEIEKTVIGSQQRQSAWGQNYAFIIAIFVLAGSMWLIAGGHEISGSVLGSIDLVSLVTVFIMGRFYQAGNLQSKNPQKTISKKS